MQVFSLREGSYSGATLALAIEVKDGSRNIIRGVMRFTDEEAQPNENQDYGRLLLYRTSLTCKEAIQFLNAAIAGDALPGSIAESRKLQFKRVDWRPVEFLTTPIGHERLSEWPSAEFLLKPLASSSDPSGPLIKPNLPAAVYPSQTIDSWIGANEQRHRIEGGLAVILPDYRARIKKIDFSSDFIDVDIEARLLSEKSMVLKAVIDGKEVPIDHSDCSSSARISIKDLPSVFHFFVLDSETEDTIDWARIYLDWRDLPQQVEFSSPNQQIEHLIASGESRTIEFKMERSDGFKFMQSVVAFANTDGGIIIIGVGDDAKIVGTDPIGDEDKIREWVERRCDPPIELTFREALVEEKKVLVVHVPKGPNVPYLLRDNNGIYVRRGATDRPAGRSEIMAMISRDSFRGI